MGVRKYTDEQLQWIREKAKEMSMPQMLKPFNERFGTDISYRNLRSIAHNYHIKCEAWNTKARYSELWPKEAAEFLKEHLHTMRYAQAIEELRTITGREYTRDQIKAYAVRNGLKSAFDGRFVKGQKNPYPIMKGVRLSPQTEYKKGHRPHNWRPVGTVITDTDGFLKIKVAEPRTWEFVHRRNWIQAHGAIPKGGCIIFLDGDRQNCDISNLALVTKSENYYMNTHGGRTEDPEITRAGLLIARIKIARNRRK